jgi:hypothetical protein
VSQLRRILDAIDPVPAHVVEAGKAAFGWRDIDAELAALSYDSVLDTALTGVRSSTSTHRTLSFGAAGRSVEIELAPDALVGQLLPFERAVVDVRTSSDLTTVDTDELGRFELRPPPTGPVSLRIRRPPVRRS